MAYYDDYESRYSAQGSVSEYSQGTQSVDVDRFERSMESLQSRSVQSESMLSEPTQPELEESFLTPVGSSTISSYVSSEGEEGSLFESQGPRSTTRSQRSERSYGSRSSNSSGRRSRKSCDTRPSDVDRGYNDSGYDYGDSYGDVYQESDASSSPYRERKRESAGVVSDDSYTADSGFGGGRPHSFHHGQRQHSEGTSTKEDSYNRGHRSFEHRRKNSEVERYAAIARKKASLMTNYNFVRDEKEPKSPSSPHKSRPLYPPLPPPLPPSHPRSNGSSKRSSSRRGSGFSDSAETRSTKNSHPRSMGHSARGPSSPKSTKSRHSSSSRSGAGKSSSRMDRDEYDPHYDHYDRDRSSHHDHGRSGETDYYEERSYQDPEPDIPYESPQDDFRDNNRGPPRESLVNQSGQLSVVGKSVSADASAASSVSSMSTMDSYMRQQFMIREMARYKREQRRREREEQEMEQGGEEGEGHPHGFESIREDEPYLPSKSVCSSRYGAGHSTAHSQGHRSRHSGGGHSRYSHGHQSHAHSRGGRSRFSNSESDFSSHHTNKSPTPVYQIEECCIKHPHVLLSDQTNVDVWTCMRYCKDEKSGRWITVKKVCRECLEEMEAAEEEEAMGIYDEEEVFSMYSNSEDTCSMSDSQDAENGAGRETVNVHCDDGNQTPLEREAEAQKRRFIRRLAARAYHFPGNTWCEDWLQYTKNTHLVFGIFFHHPLHPVTSRERCIILLGSVAVGLLMSNLIYLWFVHYEIGLDETAINLGNESLNISKFMITLWTLGSFVHTCFDLSVWHIKACTLCRYGGNVSDQVVKCGRTSGVTIVMVTLAFATYLVLLRASSDYEASQGEEVTYTNAFFHSIALGGGAESFDFLAGYIIEFILAVFVYSPLLLTVVFTGVLGCKGRIPVLGGRPREVAKEQRYAMKRQRYTMPQTLKLGNEEYTADMWGDANQKLATNF